MFCGKTQNKEIDRVHKRALRILFNDYTSSLEELLKKIESMFDPCKIVIGSMLKSLQNLMIEIFKCLSYENQSFMWNIFERKELTYNLRSGTLLQLPKAKTTTYSTSSLAFRVSILWNSLPGTIKDSASVDKFKILIKEWKGDNCKYKNCR